MKPLVIFALLITSLAAAAQSASLEKLDDRDVINFSVSREANVRNYVIEGANDSTHFEVIGTVASPGNTVHLRNYTYENTDKKFKNYLVRQMDYNGLCTLTQSVFEPKVTVVPVEEKNLRTISSR